MIAATFSPSQPAPQPLAAPNWQQVLAHAITDPHELLALVGLSDQHLPQALQAAHAFGLRVPRGFVRRMRYGDANDPLLRQVLPLAAENLSRDGFGLDPVGDLESRVASGVLHKYHGRALVIATGACAVHCRYCFRRHFPYADELASSDGWRAALDTLRSDASIGEVILSGGDPLSLSDRRLTQFTDALRRIPHVRRIRVHTRQPIVLPERVDSGLLQWLKACGLQKVMVLHANHAQEIDADVRRACRALADTGTVLLNQAVLLAGVNDSIEALVDLSEALFDTGVMPYYLHMLDRVQGAAHFEVSQDRARQLVNGVNMRLPGYLVPKLVREVSGAGAKTPIDGFGDDAQMTGN